LTKIINMARMENIFANVVVTILYQNFQMELMKFVKFVFGNPQIKSLRYSGTILRGKPIDQILEIMKITADIQYKITVKNNSPNIIYLN